MINTDTMNDHIDFESEVIANSMTGPVLVDFYMDSCAPCRQISPMLHGLVDEDICDLVKIDIIFERKLALEYNVMKVPTLLMFYRGKVYWDSRNDPWLGIISMYKKARGHALDINYAHTLWGKVSLFFKNLFTK